MPKKMTIHKCCLWVALLPGLPGCLASSMFFGQLPQTGQPLPTIDGPEEPALLEGTSGTLIALDREDLEPIQVVSLPGLTQRKVRIDDEPYAISGPDEDGRLVYLVLDDWKGLHRRPTYVLHVVSLADGKDTLLLERPGDLTGGTSISLAPRGGRVALLRSFNLGGFRSTVPQLEVIDLSTGATTAVAGPIAG